MKRSELRDLALLGVRRKIEAIERQLVSYQQEFPELFISQTPPAILKAEEKPEGGTWAIPAPPMKTRKRYVMTAAHKRNLTAANQARARKAPTPGRSTPTQTRLTDQVATFLRVQGPVPAKAIRKALKVKARTTITSALMRLQQRGIVQRQGRLWSLKTGRVARKAATNGAWGTLVWQQVHDAITAQGGRATMQQIIKAVGKPSATIISSIDPHMKTGVFTRVDKGVYAVTSERPTAQEAS